MFLCIFGHIQSFLWHRVLLQVKAVGPTQSLLQVQVEMSVTDSGGHRSSIIIVVELRVPPMLACVEASAGFEAPIEFLNSGRMQLAIRDMAGVTNAGHVAVYVERTVVQPVGPVLGQIHFDCHRWLTMDAFQVDQMVGMLPRKDLQMGHSQHVSDLSAPGNHTQLANVQELEMRI